METPEKATRLKRVRDEKTEATLFAKHVQKGSLFSNFQIHFKAASARPDLTIGLQSPFTCFVIQISQGFVEGTHHRLCTGDLLGENLSLILDTIPRLRIQFLQLATKSTQTVEPLLMTRSPAISGRVDEDQLQFFVGRF